MGFRQFFRLGDGNIFIAHVFSRLLLDRFRKESCLLSRVFRRLVVLLVTVVRCFLNVQFLSSLDISSQLFSRLMSAQLMSLTTFKTRDVFSTLLQGKYRVISETCQMTMNYVFSR
jgi:hypothetical protein